MYLWQLGGDGDAHIADGGDANGDASGDARNDGLQCMS